MGGFFLRFDTPSDMPLIVRAAVDSATLLTISIPEPASHALLGHGLLGLCLLRRQQGGT